MTMFIRRSGLGRWMIAGSAMVAAGLLSGCTAENTTTPEETDAAAPVVTETAAETPAADSAEAPVVDMAEAPAAADAHAAHAADAAATPGQRVAVRGVVKWDGPAPTPHRLDAGADPKCAAMHGADNPLMSKQEVVSEEGEVQYVFMYVSNPPDGEYEPPAQPAVLDQTGCEYQPHVFGMVAGQELEVRNSDPTLHNVRSFARVNKPFNMGQPEGTSPRTQDNFKKAEDAIKFKCDVHPWMQAFAFVLEHPFFSVTNADGQYEIGNLPAGTYTLVAWHEKYGEQEQEITVPESGAAEANFTYSPAN